MMKIDTSMDKYEGKVVPQVQVLQVKKFYLGGGEVTLLGCVVAKYKITKN